MHVLGVFLWKLPGLILMDVVYVDLFYNWLNSRSKWRQTPKTPLQPFGLNNRDTNNTHSQCIFSIHDTPDFTSLQYNIMPFLSLHLRMLKKERLCASVYLSVCMPTFIALARGQGHSDSSDCTQRSGEIGVDKMRLMPQWRRVFCIPMGLLCWAPAAQRSHTEWRGTQNNRQAPGSHKHNLWRQKRKIHIYNYS